MASRVSLQTALKLVTGTRGTSRNAREWVRTLRLVPGYDPFRDAKRGMRFSAPAAQRVLDFFSECLTHVEGELAGDALALQPWQEAALCNLFGWLRGDGLRRYRTMLLYLPRKNGKTTQAAGVANYVTFCDDEPGAQVFCAAAETQQARLLFRPAKAMIEAEPELMSRCNVYRDSVEVPDTLTYFRVLSKVADSKHGLNAHCVIVDELHAQPNAELVDVLKTSTGARRQPLVVYITTADYDRESVCNSEYDYACKVRDGVIGDASYLPVIYEASNDDDWTDPRVWARANPNLGVSVRLDYLEQECERAKNQPSYENWFKRVHLNIRTEQLDRWLQLDKWDKCGADACPFEPLAGRPCYAGLDLASTTDLAALVLLFPDDDDARRYWVRPYFWVPEDGARDRSKYDRVPYLEWITDGLISATPGASIDYDVIRRDINEIAAAYDIKEIALDRWNATQISGQLDRDGLTMVPFGQGMASMSAPSKEFESLIASARVRHDRNAVLRWMVSNAAAEIDAAGNVKPNKKRSRDRIDGVVALIMALGRAMLRGDGDDDTSVYERRGVIEL